jgi:hypothetical protein
MNDLESSDKDRQNRAFESLSKATVAKVDWAYDVWDDLLRLTLDGDNRQRSIAAQILCNIAKSDGEKLHPDPLRHPGSPAACVRRGG